MRTESERLLDETLSEAWRSAIISPLSPRGDRSETRASPGGCAFEGKTERLCDFEISSELITLFVAVASHSRYVRALSHVTVSTPAAVHFRTVSCER